MAVRDKLQRRLAILIGVCLVLAAFAPVHVVWREHFPLEARYFWGETSLFGDVRLAVPADLISASRAVLLAIGLYYLALAVVRRIPRRVAALSCLAVHCAMLAVADKRIFAEHWWWRSLFLWADRWLLAGLFLSALALVLQVFFVTRDTLLTTADAD